MKTSLPIRSALCLLAMIPMWGEAKQPSKRPLIQKSPDYAAWSIVMSGRDRADATGSAQPSPPSLTAPQTTVDGDDPVVKWNFKKTKDVTRVECVTKSGKSGVVWIIGGMQVVQMPGQTSWLVDRHMSSSNDPFWMDLGPYGYPHTGIVSAKTYQDTGSFMGKKCFRFETQLHDPIEDDPAKGNYDILVYVEERSRLPVYAAGLVNAYTFQFSKAPQGDLTPPPEVTKAIEDESKRRERLNAVPPHA